MAFLPALPAIFAALGSSAAAGAGAAAGTAAVTGGAITAASSATAASLLAATAVPTIGAVTTAGSGLATAGLAATAAGAGVSAYGQLAASHAASESAKYNANLSAQNAKIAEQNAQIASQSGEQQAGISEMRTRANVGAIKANQAASGVDVSSGSPVDVRSSAAELGELDALTVRSNATREAYGYSQQASSLKAQSALDSYEAKQDQEAGVIGAAGTFLGGVGQAGLNFARYQQAGGMMA